MPFLPVAEERPGESANIGASTHIHQERAWKMGEGEMFSIDVEQEHDGREPDVDDEPDDGLIPEPPHQG